MQPSTTVSPWCPLAAQAPRPASGRSTLDAKRRPMRDLPLVVRSPAVTQEKSPCNEFNKSIYRYAFLDAYRPWIFYSTRSLYAKYIQNNYIYIYMKRGQTREAQALKLGLGQIPCQDAIMVFQYTHAQHATTPQRTHSYRDLIA